MALFQKRLIFQSVSHLLAGQIITVCRHGGMAAAIAFECLCCTVTIKTVCLNIAAHAMRYQLDCVHCLFSLASFEPDTYAI
jgi:hypothetical protein